MVSLLAVGHEGPHLGLQLDRVRLVSRDVLEQLAHLLAYVQFGIAEGIDKEFGHYTILPSPILYGEWHKQGGVGGGAYIAQSACNSIAIG